VRDQEDFILDVVSVVDAAVAATVNERKKERKRRSR